MAAEDPHLPRKVWAGTAAVGGAAFWHEAQDRAWAALKWCFDKAFGDAAFQWITGAFRSVLGLDLSGWLWAHGPAIALSGAGIYMFASWRRASKAERSRPDAPAVTEPGRLAFVFGDDSRFSEYARVASGAVRRTVRVAVANTGGTELTECRVRVEGVTPGRQPPAAPLEKVPIHTEPFRLPGCGKRTLDLAFYDEALPDGSPAADIVINMPDATFRDFFKVSAAKAQTVVLRSEAAEGVFAGAACRLFVENGRLRLVEL